MNEIKEINYLTNKFDKLLGHHYKNTGKLKYDTIKAIQNIVKEILKANNLLLKVRYMCNICDDNRNLKYQKNELEKLIMIDKEKLRIIIQYILISKQLRQKFEIEGNINIFEMERLLEDIENNIVLLNFNKDKDISNFILGYMRKFLKVH